MKPYRQIDANKFFSWIQSDLSLFVQLNPIFDIIKQRIFTIIIAATNSVDSMNLHCIDYLCNHLPTGMWFRILPIQKKTLSFCNLIGFMSFIYKYNSFCEWSNILIIVINLRLQNKINWESIVFDGTKFHGHN